MCNMELGEFAAERVGTGMRLDLLRAADEQMYLQWEGAMEVQINGRDFCFCIASIHPLRLPR